LSTGNFIGNFILSQCHRKPPSKHFAMRRVGILSDHVFSVAGGALNIVSFLPGFLIEPHDAQEDGQEEEPQHEVRSSPEETIQ
jgi:hypothetical protein